MRFHLFVLVVVALLVSTLSHAQERATVDVNRTGGNFSSSFSYPQDLSVQSGKQYETNGIGLTAKVRITDTMSAGYRFEHNGLRNAENVYESIMPKGTLVQTEPDRANNGGIVRYQEFFGSFELPKAHGHALVVGVVKSEFEQSWLWQEQGGIGTSRQRNSFIGLVIGGEGRQKLGLVTFSYAGRVYPRLNQTTGFGGDFQGQLESTGFELRGTATWSVAKHVGLTGGYQFRRMNTDSMVTGANGRPWSIQENQDNKGFVVGTQFSF